MNLRMSQCQKEEAEAVECGGQACCLPPLGLTCVSDREGEMELDTSRDLGTFSLLSSLIKEGFLEEEKGRRQRRGRRNRRKSRGRRESQSKEEKSPPGREDLMTIPSWGEEMGRMRPFGRGARIEAAARFP